MEPGRVPLILAPTPMHRLERTSERLGIDLWIKRDDLTGFAMGGNKGRKLEYLMADAIARRAEVVVSCGSLQSNFLRQLAAACSRFGIDCAAAAMSLPFDSAAGKPAGQHLTPGGGNVLLDRILGLDLRTIPDGAWESLYDAAEEIAVEFERKGKAVCRIPIGGSTPLGAFSFVKASQEVRESGQVFDQIVFASSSGSTHTGLAYAFHGSRTRVLGISCDPEPSLVEDFAKLGNGLSDLLGSDRRLRPEDFNLDLGYVGPGYGVPSQAGMAAIERLAREEGIFLDPIYSAKAFAGLEDGVKGGRIEGKTLFWHTGGTPSLFALNQ